MIKKNINFEHTYNLYRQKLSIKKNNNNDIIMTRLP